MCFFPFKLSNKRPENNIVSLIKKYFPKGVILYTPAK